MARQERDIGERLLYAVLGAFLGGLSSVSTLFWVDVHLWVVGVCAALGFIAGWLFGEEAVAFLASVWSWWWWW